ncbi:hypothetical protein ACFLYI_02035, partial [Chloroflexota bacterium]
MRLIRRNNHNDVIFLLPVRLTGEKLPKGKVRMLYCDAEGKVYASLIDKAVYKFAKDSAQKVGSHKYYATLGLEIGPGNFAPMSVEVSSEEVWALEHILEHALKSGKVPYIMKKYLQQIIKLGEASREVSSASRKKRKLRVTSEATPPVLNRLPYYSEHGIEFSMPIYKAEHNYPLIVLKRLSLDDQIPRDVQRLLILDSDGDLAVIKVPFKLMDQAEKRLKEWAKKNDMNACIVVSLNSEGFAISHMVISQLQGKALDTMA